MKRTVLIIDRSWSMSCHDYPPSRIRAAIEAAKEFVQARRQESPTDEVAVVAFSDMTWLALPLSSVSQCDTAKLDQIFPEGETDAESALLLAAKQFPNEIVLLSDGYSAGNPERVARELKQGGVKIFAIGIGSRSGVNEVLLRKVASPGCYRFVGDREGLIQTFNDVATGTITFL